MNAQTPAIPNGWKKTTLGETASLITDFVANGSFASLKENVEYKYTEDYAVLIRLVDFNNGFTNLLYTDKKAYDFLKKSSLHPKDIIISNVGEYSGTVFRVPQIQKPMTLAPNTILVRFDNDSNDFFYFLLKGPVGQALINNIKTGSANPKFNKTDFRRIEVDIPPVPEQKAIAAVLSSLEDKIELLREQNKTLEATAQAIFKEWFVNFNFPGSTGKMIDSELGVIPEGWKINTLMSFGRIVCGKTPSKNIQSYFGGDIPFIKIPDMHGHVYINHTEDSLTEAGANSQKNKYIPEYSICVSCIATVGLVSICSKRSQTNQQINSIVPKSPNYLEYLFFSLRNMESELQAIGTGGSATLNINTTTFSNIEIIVPETSILESYHNAVSPLFQKLNTNNIQIQTLTSLRDGLLPKLMKGEIRVKGFS